MTKILYVGDPHVQIKNLKDSEALTEYIIKLAKEQKVDNITYLGDLFHTHAVKRIEVEHFWKNTFKILEYEGLSCRVLVGNHDQPGSREKEQEMNALNIFIPENKIVPRKIINKPTIIDNIAYIPYMSDKEAFLQNSKLLHTQGATGMLVAHQTFTGAQYENGFFSEDGIDPALVSQKEIISGHIHKSQQVGKCFYPGTPKWDTMSDANQPKGLYVIEHNEDGTIKEKKWFNTEFIVTPIKSYEIKEGDELPELNSEARNYVVLEGKSAWITKTKKKFKDIASIKVKPTDRIVRVDRKNSTNIKTYLEKEFEPVSGVTRNELAEYLRNI